MNEAVPSLPTDIPTNARFMRYAGVDLSGIAVRRASTEADLEIVGRLRQAGFSRKANGVADWVDELDRSPSVFSLIGFNGLGEPVATMRIQDGRAAELELASFVALDSLVDPMFTPAAQFGRLSVIKEERSLDAMFGLFKAAWRWCFAEGIQGIIIATPPWSKPIYDFMHFQDLGTRGQFDHHLAGGALHVTMALPVVRAESIWRAHKNPLCAQLFDTEHPSLILD